MSEDCISEKGHRDKRKVAQRIPFVAHHGDYVKMGDSSCKTKTDKDILGPCLFNSHFFLFQVSYKETYGKNNACRTEDSKDIEEGPG